jgi:hypothetical protein
MVTATPHLAAAGYAANRRAERTKLDVAATANGKFHAPDMPPPLRPGADCLIAGVVG